MEPDLDTALILLIIAEVNMVQFKQRENGVALFDGLRGIFVYGLAVWMIFTI